MNNLELELVAARYGVGACVPTSADFRDGSQAEGAWEEENGRILVQVAGSSGVYLIEHLGQEVIRDGRPWQMTS